MKHHEISGAMPGLKYDADAAITEAEAMVDRLAATPTGHPTASELSQKIKSSLGRIRSAIDNVQPDGDGADFGGPQPNGGRVFGDGGNPANIGDPSHSNSVNDPNARAGYDGRFAELEGRMATLEEKVDTLHADLGGASGSEFYDHETDEVKPPKEPVKPAERQVVG